jgi:hypothetical protein
MSGSESATRTATATATLPSGVPIKVEVAGPDSGDGMTSVGLPAFVTAGVRPAHARAGGPGRDDGPIKDDQAHVVRGKQRSRSGGNRSCSSFGVTGHRHRASNGRARPRFVGAVQTTPRLIQGQVTERPLTEVVLTASRRMLLWLLACRGCVHRARPSHGPAASALRFAPVRSSGFRMLRREPAVELAGGGDAQGPLSGGCALRPSWPSGASSATSAPSATCSPSTWPKRSSALATAAG